MRGGFGARRRKVEMSAGLLVVVAGGGVVGRAPVWTQRR